MIGSPPRPCEALRYNSTVTTTDLPGALSLPFTGNLDPETKRFLSPDRLRERYLGARLSEQPGGRRAVAYCGSGINACHTLLALEIAGLPAGRLLPGSWSQWGADRSLPVATGEEP